MEEQKLFLTNMFSKIEKSSVQSSAALHLLASQAALRGLRTDVTDVMQNMESPEPDGASTYGNSLPDDGFFYTNSGVMQRLTPSAGSFELFENEGHLQDYSHHNLTLSPPSFSDNGSNSYLLKDKGRMLGDASSSNYSKFISFNQSFCIITVE